MGDNLKLLALLYVRPLRAMSGILDEGSWLFGALAVIAVSLLLQYPHLGSGPPALSPAMHAQWLAAAQAAEATEDGEAPAPRHRTSTETAQWLLSYDSYSIFTAVTLLALVYVPANVLLMSWLESLGRFMTIIYRDYASLLACASMAWTAAHLPGALARIVWTGLHKSPLDSPVLPAISIAYFLVLMVCALRVVFGARFATASVSAVVTCVLAVAARLFYPEYGYAMSYLASPFFLFYGYRYVSGDLHQLGSGLRLRQSFRRHLEASTVNPNDGDAHLQLGLIYQQRRQYTQAIERFERAVKIDPKEADAHFQLGRIAHEQGRFEQAIHHLEAAARIDKRHSSHEVWREMGAVYIALGRLDDARNALEHYTGQRTYDPEGLYYLGLAMQKGGRHDEARSAYDRCIEAVDTMPHHRRGKLARWRRLASGQIGRNGLKSA